MSHVNSNTEMSSLAFGDIKIYPHARQVLISDRPANLSGAQYEALMLLVERNGEPVGRMELAERALGHQWHGAGDRSVDQLITKLRSSMTKARGDVPESWQHPLPRAVRTKGYWMPKFESTLKGDVDG